MPRTALSSLHLVLSSMTNLYIVVIASRTAFLYTGLYERHLFWCYSHLVRCVPSHFNTLHAFAKLINLSCSFLSIPLISIIIDVPINVAPGKDNSSKTESVRELNPIPMHQRVLKILIFAFDSIYIFTQQ